MLLFIIMNIKNANFNPKLMVKLRLKKEYFITCDKKSIKSKLYWTKN